MKNLKITYIIFFIYENVYFRVRTRMENMIPLKISVDGLAERVRREILVKTHFSGLS